jgi:hypothetical protein
MPARAPSGVVLDSGGQAGAHQASAAPQPSVISRSTVFAPGEKERKSRGGEGKKEHRLTGSGSECCDVSRDDVLLRRYLWSIYTVHGHRHGPLWDCADHGHGHTYPEKERSIPVRAHPSPWRQTRLSQRPHLQAVGPPAAYPPRPPRCGAFGRRASSARTPRRP